MASSTNDKTAVWFITGCSTGIGRALAERVLAARLPLRGDGAQPRAGGADRGGPPATGAGPRPRRDRPGPAGDGRHEGGSALRRHRRAREQRGQRLQRRGRRSERGRGPRHVRSQLLRARGHDAPGAAGHARTRQRPHHQRVLGRRPDRQSGFRVLLRHQVRGRGPFAGTRQGSREPRHPRDAHRARAVSHGLPGPVHALAGAHAGRVCADRGRAPCAAARQPRPAARRSRCGPPMPSSMCSNPRSRRCSS